MKIGLFYKLLIAFLAIGILAVLISGLIIQGQMKHELTGWVEKDLADRVQIISTMPEEEINKNAATLAEKVHARLTLIDASGWVTFDSDFQAKKMDNHLNRPEIQEARLKGKGTAIRYSRTLKTDMLYLALPVYDKGTVKRYIRLAHPLSEVTDTINQLQSTVFEVILLVMMLSMFAAIIFSIRILSPLWDMEEFTEKIKKGDVSGTLMVKSQDEIGRLARNINDMVSELQNRIKAADEESQTLQSAFASMIEGVIVLDSDGHVEVLNKGMHEMLGSRYGDIVGKTVMEAFRNVELHDALDRYHRTGHTVIQEFILGIENPIVLEVTISPIKTVSSGVEKTIMVFHDVTHLKRLEQIRADFIANVTHEIKTPLTAIIGFAQTLLQGDLGNRTEAIKFLQTIHTNAQRLNRLVDDLLILSNIELGETKLQLETIDLNNAIENALVVVQNRMDDKKIMITKELPLNLPNLMADKDKLQQILVNVLDNAVKFTSEGGLIFIKASQEETEFIVVSITDTGIGIPKNEIPRLGERFYRVDKTRSRDVGGTGLGLSIVKHLIIAHRGKMNIQSSPGRGTTVSLYFPLSRSDNSRTQ
jgi:two-component system phosphate regulon sensor histidine kinase PhoR